MSVQVPKGYKQTEVGVIPEDWQVKKLSKLASFRTGPFGSALHKSDYIANGVPVINPMHIIDGQINPSEDMTINEVTANKLSEFRLTSGEIIIGRRGDMGRCAVVHEENGGWLCGTGSMIVRPKNHINPQFLQRVLSSPAVISAIEETSVGSTMINLNQSTLGGLWIQTPLALEQQAIAEALSDADALIESLEQLIAKKRQIKQGAMQELLTGQRRLPEFSGEWIQQRLGDIAHIKTGGRNNQDKVENGEFPFFVRSATVERINTFTYDCEAILVPGEGGIGSIFHYIFGKFDVHQRVYAITQFAGNVSGKFIYYYMKTYFGRHAMENSVKATVDSLRLPTFQDFAVKIPSSVEEQIEIASILSEMEQELEVLEERLQKTQKIKQSMMQELLTGHIRLL